MKKYRLGFIGCGNMARAIIGCLNGESVKYLLKLNKIKLDIYGYDADTSKSRNIKGLTESPDAKTLTEVCDIVFLSVKPQNAADAVKDLSLNGKIVVSIMAGVSLSRLSELTGAEKLVRVMPNLNARVGASFNAFCPIGLNAEEEHTVKLLLESFGETVKVDERDMNAVTGIAGSGPAFVFMFIKAFTDAGVQYGFDYALARKMAVATVVGSAYNIESDPDSDLDAMISSVCSKGGTTIRGVNRLNEGKFCETVQDAISCAVKRAEEMERGE